VPAPKLSTASVQILVNEIDLRQEMTSVRTHV